MAITFRLDGARPSRVMVGCSPLAELMACLHVLTEQDHHPHQQNWTRAVSAALPADVVAGLRRFAPLWARYRCRLLFPLSPPVERTLEEELAVLGHLNVDVVAEFLGYAIIGTHLGSFASILRDDRLQAQVLHEAARKSVLREELAERLFADPDGVRTDMINVLLSCRAPFFDEYWGRVHGRLRTAAAALRRRLATEPLPPIFASLGPASRLEHDPERVVYDKLQHAVVDLADRQCLIVPSVQSYPHLIIKYDERWPIVVHAPLPPMGDAAAPSLAEIRRRLVILADPQRLKLCRHLASEPITTSDLASRTGMSAPQVSRHLTRLRTVGLVSSDRQGRLVYHRLHTDVINRIGLDLTGAILR